MTNHYNYAKHIKRQLLVMGAVLLGATLLLVGLVPPQEAQGKEHQQQQNPTPPPQWAQSEEHQQKLLEQSATPPAQGTEEAQDKERVLDKDPEGNEVVAGELLVTYEKGASKQAKEEAPKKVGAKVKKDFPTIEVQHLSVPEVKNEKAQEARQKALERKKQDLEQDPDIKAVDYNYVRRGAMVPNDNRYLQQWGYPKIEAPEAWDITQGTRSVKVAILDSGIDMNHPDLKGKVVAQYDYVGNDSDATDDVANGGHGTHVAGTVAANTNNFDSTTKNWIGGAGTCPNCTLVNAKVADKNGAYYDSNVIYAIHFALHHNANVINMSFAGEQPNSALEAAIDYAWNIGAVVVASAGNKGKDIYPAAYQNVIAVAATDKDNKRALFDDPKTPVYDQSNIGEYVDVAAPGKDILSTTTGANYASYSGTSMAAPHVSGLAGLLFSKGKMSNGQVRNQIEAFAWDLGATGKDNAFGHGLIDALNSVYNIKPATAQEDSPKITYSAGDWTRYSWSSASGGYTNWASRPGATAKLSFTGNSVAWWVNRGPYGGKAKVYVDGAYAQTVDLYSARNELSQPAFSKSWGDRWDKHTIEIVVEGTSGRPWVDVDAFTVGNIAYCSSNPTASYCL